MDQIGNFSSLKIGGDETEKCIEAMINLQNITENDFFWLLLSVILSSTNLVLFLASFPSRLSYIQFHSKTSRALILC